MAKNVIIAVLIFIIIAGIVYWQFELKNQQQQPIAVESPVPIIIELTPDPDVTQTPQIFNYYYEQTTPIYATPEPTIDPYWIPGPWGNYNH